MKRRLVKLNEMIQMKDTKSMVYESLITDNFNEILSCESVESVNQILTDLEGKDGIEDSEMEIISKLKVLTTLWSEGKYSQDEFKSEASKLIPENVDEAVVGLTPEQKEAYKLEVQNHLQSPDKMTDVNAYGGLMSQSFKRLEQSLKAKKAPEFKTKDDSYKTNIQTTIDKSKIELAVLKSFTKKVESRLKQSSSTIEKLDDAFDDLPF